MIRAIFQTRFSPTYAIGFPHRVYSTLKPRTREQYIIHNHKRKLDSPKSNYISMTSDEPTSILSKKVYLDSGSTDASGSEVSSQRDKLLHDFTIIDNNESQQNVALEEDMQFQDKTMSRNKGLLINKIEEVLQNDETTTNPDIPMTNIPCPGCGALLQCQELHKVGFLPYPRLMAAMKDKNIARNSICLRCDRLSKHLDALDQNLISYDEYQEVLSVIKKRQGKATVLLVIDMLDLPGSVVPNLYQLTKADKYFLVCNKTDMIPREVDKGWMKRWSDCVLYYSNMSGIPDDLIKDIRFVSGQTGFGIEELIDSLYKRPFTNNPVYIVGCTNVGKSTIFNRLIQSDFCKSVAREYIHRSTISAWPGTTINLVKFPIQKYTKNFKEQRYHELLKRSQEKEKLLKKGKLPPNYQKLTGVVQPTNPTSSRRIIDKHQSFKNLFTYSYDVGSGQVIPSEYDHGHLQSEFIKWENFDERIYSDNSWCYDTPGYVNHNQLVNYLSVDELELFYKARTTWVPRTFVMKSGLSFIVSGLGRIDLIEGDNTVYFTSHTPLPIHIVETTEAEEYMREMSHYLLLPLPDQTRPKPLPPLASPGLFKIKGRNLSVSPGDIVLSSLGWVSVACEGEITVQAFTPGAIGCVFRIPSLLSRAVQLKGKRIFGTREFKIKQTK